MKNTTLTRTITPFDNDEEIEITMHIPEKGSGALHLLNCTVSGLEGFTDGRCFVVCFATREAAEEWFNDEARIIRTIDNEAHAYLGE